MLLTPKKPILFDVFGALIIFEYNFLLIKIFNTPFLFAPKNLFKLYLEQKTLFKLVIIIVFLLVVLFIDILFLPPNFILKLLLNSIILTS